PFLRPLLRSSLHPPLPPLPTRRSSDLQHRPTHIRLNEVVILRHFAVRVSRPGSVVLPVDLRVVGGARLLECDLGVDPLLHGGPEGRVDQVSASVGHLHSVAVDECLFEFVELLPDQLHSTLPARTSAQPVAELSGGSHEVLHGHLCGPNVCAHVMISFFMFVTVMIDGCIGRCGAHTSAFLTFHLPSISSHSAMNFSLPRTPRIAHTSASLTLSSRLDLRSWCENVASTSYPAFWAAL